MTGVIHIPYIDTDADDEKFNYDGNLFDYIGELDGVATSIIGADNYFNTEREHKTSGFNINLNKTNANHLEQVKYYEIPCVIMDSDEKPFNISTLLSYFKNEESFILIFSFDYDNSTEESLIELKSWMVESTKVMELSEDVYDRNTKMSLLPRRDFIFKSGDKINTTLSDCVYFNTYNNNNIIILVNKIIFYN